MTRNTRVAADHYAPPITQIVADFVATDPCYPKAAEAKRSILKRTAPS